MKLLKIPIFELFLDLYEVEILIFLDHTYIKKESMYTLKLRKMCIGLYLEQYAQQCCMFIEPLK